jgi:peptidoglycan DL-endopeptidase CwlO
MQYKVGRAVSANELQAGDLLFYDDGTGNPERIHHVGMYVGDGKMVDAPTEGQLVDVRAMRGDGHFIGARRIAG